VGGDYNSAYGLQALSSNTEGNLNTAIGYQAMDGNTTGTDNVGVGYQALHSNTSGNFNTAIGRTAYYTGTYTNSTALGYSANITASNQIRLGNSSVSSIGGFANWTNVSDKRLKTNVSENVPGLDFINQLKPVTYNLDVRKLNSFLGVKERPQDAKSILRKQNEIQTGFLAQDVEKAAKEVGYDFSGVDKPKNQNDYYGLRYAEFVVPLVKAVQEQQKIIESQQKEIDELKELIQKLMNKN